MSYSPEFARHGYQIDRELGCNRLGGRLTYQGTHLETGKSVVIKQFQFSTRDSSWAEFDAYEQEIQMLRSLQHPGIPRYFDSFQMADGFCMVQDYLNAKSLAEPRSWTPQQVKEVAICSLKILVYLQSQKPSVIHRDLKPENILIDREGRVYLVDFGFARMGGGEISASSVVKGTMGFMPPEQLFNRRLTAASDLYGLGGTLICLLTGTKSVDIGNLMDAEYRLHFRHLVPPLERGWMNWLEKMTEPKVGDRFVNAAAALSVLESIDVAQLPRVRLNHTTLNFTPEFYGEKLTQTIRIDNPVPNTVLAGHWEFPSHPSDPPHTPYDHAWISCDLMKFEGNQIECEVAIDTSKLLENTVYTRLLILHTNSSPETSSIEIIVKTAQLPVVHTNGINTAIGWQTLAVILFFLVGSLIILISSSRYIIFGIFVLIVPISGLITWEKTLMSIDKKICLKALKSVFFYLIFSGGIGNFFARFFYSDLDLLIAAIVGGIFGGLLELKNPVSSLAKLFDKKTSFFLKFYLVLILTTIALAISGYLLLDFSSKPDLELADFSLYIFEVLAGALIFGGTIYVITYMTMKLTYWLYPPTIRYYKSKHRTQQDSVQISLLTSGFGLSLAILWRLITEVFFVASDRRELNVELATGLAIASLAATAIPWSYLTFLKPRRLRDRYFRNLQTLIKP